MTTQLQTELQGLTTSQLRELCRKDAKLFTGHSYFTNKAALLRFMKDRIVKTVQEQPSQPSEPTPDPAPVAAPTGDAPGRKSKPAYTLQELEAFSLDELRELCVGDKKYKGYSYHKGSKPALIEFMFERGNPGCPLPPKVEKPESDHDEPIGDIKPAACKPIKSATEYLNDVAMPAQLWESQILQTLTWGRWRFGEGQSQFKYKYLSILHIPSRKHWVILWDWRSFEAACQEMIKALSRYGEAFRVDGFIPSPGYLPAPPMPEEEPPNDDDPGDCQNCAGTGEDDEGHECPMCGGDGVADSGEGDQHPGGSRREPSLVGV